MRKSFGSRALVCVALVAMSATAYVALSVTSRALAARVEAQILNAAALVSQSDFALNPAILRSVKAIAGADVITYTAAGKVLASTVDPRDASRFAAVTAADATPSAIAAEDGTPLVRHMQCGGPCDVAYRRVPARPDTFVAVVAETSELMAATRTVTRTILVAALVSLFVMVLVSQLVARRVTAPLDAFVQFTREVSGGDARRRAIVGDDEVGRLGAAFNDMLDRLEQSQAALVRSEKLGLAGLLAARVAHDIRNPMSSIKMQTQLLRARLDDAESQDIVAAVLRDITQVESVVRDLLELAKPGELKGRPSQLNDVVRDVLRQLAPQLTYRKIAVESRLADGLPEITLDAERFKQALLNIVNNAADAMPVGGTLTVATRLVDHEKTVELDVCDDGKGVNPAILAHVFDPFVSTKPDGVGLGLVNAKAVVENHGGRIELAARAPKGTRATIRLPVREGARD